MLELLSVDFMLLGEHGPVGNAAEHSSCYPAHAREKGDKRFFFVQNWVFPPYQCIMVAALDPDAEWYRNADSPQARVWRRFLDEDNEVRRRLFKVSMQVEQGPWLVKRAVASTPVVVGTKVKMDTFYKPDDYIELVFDTSTGGSVQRVGVELACKAFKQLQLVFNCIIEGQTPEQLPENVLFTAAMLNLHPERLFAPLF